jgi:hypothetical protein
MRKNFLIILCALFVLCFSSCVVVSFMQANAVAGKGAPEKYTFNVGEYNKIKVEDSCEIRYYAAPSNTVTLEIQPNLREYFLVEVKNNELIVSATKRIYFYKKKSLFPVLTVSTPVLNSLTIMGACTFKAIDKIKTDTFKLEIIGAGDGKAELDVNSLKTNMSGAGSFELFGKADNAEIKFSGAGELIASSLQMREASVNFSGAGAIRINCSEKLSIEARGVGLVEYSGSPSLSLNSSGPVSIRKVN